MKTEYVIMESNMVLNKHVESCVEEPRGISTSVCWND